MKLEIPKFESKKEKIDFLVENKDSLISQKKSVIKYADGISTTIIPANYDSDTVKSNSEENLTSINVKAIINTTNILDSHGDVHIKGLWNKSLKENKRILHIQEHKSHEFDKIIASGEDLKASVKDYSWKELGYNVEGKTQALVFDSKIRKDRNSYMFEQYKNGFVNNHSVGMRYVKIELAVNDEEYEKEKGFWDKHIKDVVNKKEAEDKGYFWVVFEAKAVEGSAVPLGSNPITPTMNIKSEPTLLEMIKNATQNKKAAESTFNILDAIKKTEINLKNS